MKQSDIRVGDVIVIARKARYNYVPPNPIRGKVTRKGLRGLYSGRNDQVEFQLLDEEGQPKFYVDTEHNRANDRVGKPMIRSDSARNLMTLAEYEVIAEKVLQAQAERERRDSLRRELAGDTAFMIGEALEIDPALVRVTAAYDEEQEGAVLTSISFDRDTVSTLIEFLRLHANV